MIFAKIIINFKKSRLKLKFSFKKSRFVLKFQLFRTFGAFIFGGFWCTQPPAGWAIVFCTFGAIKKSLTVHL
jgi:hypothetical protein